MHPNHTAQLPLFPTEEWRDIPGYEGLYQVSSGGKIKRLFQQIVTKRGHTQTFHAKDIALGLKSRYYYLSLSKNSEVRKYYVHELVALAFLGPRPEGYQVHHRNEDRLDNRVDNLEYMDSNKHKSHHKRGENSNLSVITEADVRRIRELRKTMPVHAIAKQMNISYRIVYQVASGRTWKHVID